SGTRKRIAVSTAAPTAHKSAISPSASTHQVIDAKGARAAVSEANTTKPEALLVMFPGRGPVAPTYSSPPSAGSAYLGPEKSCAASAFSSADSPPCFLNDEACTLPSRK